MSRIIITDPEYLSTYGQKFLERFDKAMADQPSGNHCALKAMDCLYETLTEVSNSFGWKVCIATNPGLDFDLFDGMTREEWNTLINECEQDLTNLHLTNMETARKTFMELLVLQVLTNVPQDMEAAKKHIKINIASLFNGSNMAHIQFALVYTDYDMLDGSFGESENLGDYLIVK